MSKFLSLIIKCGELAFKEDMFETMYAYNDSPLSLGRKERKNIGLFKVHKVAQRPHEWKSEALSGLKTEYASEKSSPCVQI